MSKKRPKQQNFSVAQKYEEVWTILDSIDNKSEFICQAIVEKFNREDDDKSHTLESIETSDLKKLIKETLNEIIEEDMFIVKGNIRAIENVSINTSKESEIEEEKPEKDNEEISDDVKQAVKSIIGGW